MRLEIDGEPPVNSPTAGDVHDALLRLNTRGPQWAVLDIRSHYYVQANVIALDTRSHHYIQACVRDDEEFIVEYREGGADRHYQAGGPQHCETVIGVFLDYLASGNRWRTAFEWRRLELP